MEELGSLITAERKEQMVHSLRKEVQSCEEKYKMYNEINHYVAEMVPRLMPTGHVLPEKDGVVRYRSKLRIQFAAEVRNLAVRELHVKIF